MNYFSINGTPCTNYGVQISVGGALNSPARNVEYIQIPGKNGDLVIDKGTFENNSYTYRCMLRGSSSADFKTKLANFRAWLGSFSGYQRITDTYSSDQFRMGVVSTLLTPEMVGSGVVAAEFDVIVNAKPQRYLTSGEATTTLTASGSITNPTAYASKPLICVYGSGTLGVGSESITIASTGFSSIYIDCDAMDAYSGATPVNDKITLSGYDFPSLEPGSNGITLGNGITKVEIVPRWWTL